MLKRRPIVHTLQLYCCFFTKKKHLNHHHIISSHWLMFDMTSSEHHYGQNNNGGATNRILFPFNILCCLCLSLSALTHRAIECSADPSHSPTIIMMCPMPPIHGAALLMYCSVSHVHAHTLTHISPRHAYIKRNPHVNVRK